MKQSRKKWFVAAICIIIVLALGTGGVIYYKSRNSKRSFRQRSMFKIGEENAG